VVAAGLVLAGAGQASAQGVASVSTPDQMRARYQISVMEGALGKRYFDMKVDYAVRQKDCHQLGHALHRQAARERGFWL
jgi:hypothetical protein